MHFPHAFILSCFFFFFFFCYHLSIQDKPIAITITNKYKHLLTLEYTQQVIAITWNTHKLNILLLPISTNTQLANNKLSSFAVFCLLCTSFVVVVVVVVVVVAVLRKMKCYCYCWENSDHNKTEREKTKKERRRENKSNIEGDVFISFVNIPTYSLSLLSSMPLQIIIITTTTTTSVQSSKISDQAHTNKHTNTHNRINTPSGIVSASCSMHNSTSQTQYQHRCRIIPCRMQHTNTNTNTNTNI